MLHKNNSTKRNDQSQADISILLGLVAVIVFFILSGSVSYWNIHVLIRNTQLVTQTHETINALDELVSLAKDAETGQRGFLLTGNEKYLEPYNTALARIDDQIGKVERLTRDYPDEQARLPQIESYLHAKISELAETIELRRTKGFDAALSVVITDRGKNNMDALRNQITMVQQEQQDIRAKRVAEMDNAYHITILSSLLTCILGVFLSGVVAYLIRRAAITRRMQEWFQAGKVGLSAAMLGEQRLESLGESILTFLSEYLDAHAGAFFVKSGIGFRRIAAYGLPADSTIPTRFDLNDGLLGQAAKDGSTLLIHDVPEGYIKVSSALGQSNPRHLVISAISADDDAVNAVIELGFIHPLNKHTLDMLKQISESIGIAVRSANYRANLQNLLEETQRQAEELQAQSEELRVANEELEEQSRVLKQSQMRLEQQQVEMEQTNAQLEEQTQILEHERDNLAHAKTTIQQKAQELEQASKYKSDFLANMSHELRTPLNSSLILSKLLADNPHGNLTEEQIKFAQTIQSSGNDLLVLINDILDLSKIEAGHMEVRPENVSLERLTNDLTRVFEPMAKQKGLLLHTHIEPDCAKIIETDRQRLEQILKNLLSNAIKFTEKGKVELTVRSAPGKQIAFAVSDTGIGIPSDQQQVIFEAFRQADGTISRRYGGTGLGLSISRELTKLLGGQIQLQSSQDEGSTFIITLPEIYQSHTGSSWLESTYIKAAPSAPSRTRANPISGPVIQQALDDDRGHLKSGQRVILIIEDDHAFARVLYDLVHELNFQCLIATTAEEALSIALQYLPNAVLLDVGLPDHSGLSVLDRLKHNARTRHIPVHVISASDYSQTAFSLGAIGYMLKPVKREELMDTLKRMESKFAQHMRRVLIVEDNDVQRESMQALLSSHDVETVGVGTAAECLACLKESTFDCMVLDLSLPDASGYSLLETLSKEEAYSFPPVIVYTGRELSADQEQLLRRYSKSIIIKGAKSPERLLDEVTLFLHQVVADLPPEQQRMLEKARSRDAVLEGRNILVVEDDVRNVYSLTSILEPRGAKVQIARNGLEALDALEKSQANNTVIDLVLMDVMMPEMDGLTATRKIRSNSLWKKLPILMLTAKAMKDDQEKCLDAGANDYMAKPLDVEKLLSLVRVWMPR